MSTVTVGWTPIEAADGHRWEVLHATPEDPHCLLVWVPALGVAARHYELFARALAERGVAVVVHEWRGLGSSSVRADRDCDWGYRELLHLDLQATCDRARGMLPGPAHVIGGHSLGGQLATCMLAIEPEVAGALWLVASGAPYHRAFPLRTRAWLPLAYRALDRIARLAGALPGRRIGFGGTEARGVIRDWSRTGLSGAYAAPGIGDLEPRLRQVKVPVRAVLLENDWLAPRSSLDHLLGKIQPTSLDTRVLGRYDLGTRADHFAWMQAPDPVAEALVGASTA